MAVHVPFALRLREAGATGSHETGQTSRQHSAVEGEPKRVRWTEDPRVFKLRDRMVLQAELDVVWSRAVWAGDDPTVPVDMEDMKIRSHPDNTKPHQSTRSSHHRGCIPKILPPIDAHSGVMSEFVEQLEVLRLFRRSSEYRQTDLVELIQRTIELEAHAPPHLNVRWRIASRTSQTEIVQTDRKWHRKRGTDGFDRTANWITTGQEGGIQNVEMSDGINGTTDIDIIRVL